MHQEEFRRSASVLPIVPFVVVVAVLSSGWPGAGVSSRADGRALGGHSVDGIHNEDEYRSQLQEARQ